MGQLKIMLSSEEYDALARMSDAQLRSVPEQARWILRRALAESKAGGVLQVAETAQKCEGARERKAQEAVRV